MKFSNTASKKQLQIRNSTADFLVFTRQNGEDGIAVRVEDENVVFNHACQAHQNPVRDFSSVEKIRQPQPRMPLGMRTYN